MTLSHRMSLPFTLPVVEPAVSILLAGFVATSYVGSLYLFKSTRLIFAASAASVKGQTRTQERQQLEGEQWRNEPRVIRARLTAVSLSSILCCGLVYMLVWRACKGDVRPLLNRTDFPRLTRVPREARISVGCHNTPSRIRAERTDIPTASPHAITLLCPVYVSFLDGALPFQSRWTGLQPLRDWQGIRNYIGVCHRRLGSPHCLTSARCRGHLPKRSTFGRASPRCCFWVIGILDG